MFFNTSDFTVDELSVFRFDWDPQRTPSSFRPYHALSFRLKGDARFICDTQTVTVQTGDILFIPAHSKYILESGEEQVCVIHFTSARPLPVQIQKFTPGFPTFFEQCFLELYQAWTRKLPGYEHECRSLFHKLIMHLEREYHSSKNACKYPQILQATKYLHEHFTDPNLTVSSLAADYHISDTYFRRLFLEVHRVTPLVYLNRLKREYALSLLQSGYYTVSETAEKCGFANQYYFSTFIKRETGFAPSALIPRR
jgi:AraC-like DNA-binding protein